MTALKTTLALHRAWWDAASELARQQAQDCGCWDIAGDCEKCKPLGRAVVKAEVDLREAGEWTGLPSYPEDANA